MMEKVWENNEEKSLNALKEVHGYLGQVFKAEPEKDYAFLNMPPGYPLTALPLELQAPLLKMVSQCPPLAQESMFRYCVDLLLGELSSGTSSYGTRIMLLLLIQCNGAVCVETVSRIKICLETNISKVPEALSLLWVGLPHPKLHPLTVMRTWPELCLPLFQRSNIPRQVFAHAVDYTCLLIRCCTEGGNDGMLLEALSPTTLSSLLTSSQLVHKRTQKNVKEMLDSAQDAVLTTASQSSRLHKYFRATFKQITPENDLLLGFSVRCLQKSGRCWEVWSEVSPPSPASCTLLLKELNTAAKSALAPSPLPLDKVADILGKLTRKLSEKERALARDLLSTYADALEHAPPAHASSATPTAGGAESERRGYGKGCVFLVTVLSLAYLCLLTVFLYRVSTQGVEVFLPDLVRGQDVFAMWRQLALGLDKICLAKFEQNG